jgi:hypothetical protein
MSERPWSHAINKAAWKRRHKFGIDGRLLIGVVCPLLLLGGFGFSLGRLVMIVFVLLAAAVWFAGKLQWEHDPWLIDKLLIEMRLPRWGPATKERR